MKFLLGDGECHLPLHQARNKVRFTAVVEYCKDTGLYVGYVPGFAGAHSQGETLDELNRNLTEVVKMLLEDGKSILDSEFVCNG